MATRPAAPRRVFRRGSGLFRPGRGHGPAAPRDGCRDHDAAAGHLSGLPDRRHLLPADDRMVEVALPAGNVSSQPTATAAAPVPGADTAKAIDSAMPPGGDVAPASPATRPADTAQPAGDGIPVAGGFDTSPAEGDLPASSDVGAATQAEDSRLAAALSGPNRWWAPLRFFGFGLLLAFTPCVLPMIPILSGLIAGASAGHERGLGAGRALGLSFVYVLANALVFTVAGVVAGLVGANVQIAFQNPWVLATFAALFVALALSSFGLFELQLPSRLRNRLGALSDRQRGGSLAG